MNRNFIFAFILLVILSIVNASPIQLDGKNVTQFKECEDYPGSDVDLLTVKLTPDPLEPGEQTIEVSITLKDYDISQGTVLNIDIEGVLYYSVDLCSRVDCPVTAGSKAGSPFSTTQKFALAKLPSKYSIRAEHFLNAPDVTIPYSCAIATIG